MCQAPAPSDAPSTEGAATAAAPSSKPTSRRSTKDPTLIAGKEVVGRQVAVWSDKTMEWAKASIAQFNADKGQHLVRFADREPGSVKHEELWVTLSKIRFQWLGNPPPNAPPNPTFAGAPKGDEAVGYRVRVFWPGMARWYQGTVQSYEASTGTHTVRYRDGDVQRLRLRYEAVVYLDKLKTPPRERPRASRDDRRPGSKRIRSGGAADGSRSKSGGSRDEGPPRPSTASPPKKRKVAGTHVNSSSTSDVEEDDEIDMTGSSDDENDDHDDGSMESGEETELSSDDDGSEASGVHGRKTARRSGSGASARRRNNALARRISRLPPQEGAPRRRGRPPGSGTGGGSAARRMARAPPPRPMNLNDEMIRSAGAAVVGARVAVFWNDELSYYKGKLVQFDSYHKRHKVVYDDGEEEWISLPREIFRYLSPRAQSAGCNNAFRHAMAQLGADQETGPVGGGGGGGGHNSPPVLGCLAGTTTPQREAVDQPPPAADAVGWMVSVRSPSDGRWHLAEVLCYDTSRDKHLLLYNDGEDEWVTFSEEEIAWHAPDPEGQRSVFPGKPSEAPAPAGRDAVGWRIAVFWPGDMAFYSGEIVAYDESDGRHDVAYDDGEESSISLEEDKVKWILPPGAAVDPEAIERMELGGGRPRRRVTVTGGESDPDYEFEQQQQQQQAMAAAGGAYGSGRGGRRGTGAPRGRPPGRSSHLHASVGPSSWEADAGDYALPTGLQSFPSLSQYQFGGAGPHNAGSGSTEGFTGEPAVIRRITRVPSFATAQAGSEAGEARLPSPVAIRIYFSSLASVRPSQPAIRNEENEPPQQQQQQPQPTQPTQPTDDTQPLQPRSIPAAVVVAPPPPHPMSLARQRRRTYSPASRLQSRLKALELMARRIGRAQQSIVKGIPTDLPTHVVRPLRMGPPPGIRALAARKGTAATHRLARPPGAPRSPFHHRRRAIEEEEEEDDEEDERSSNGRRGGDDDDGAAAAAGDGASGEERNCIGGSEEAHAVVNPASSSGSSEADGGSEGEDDEYGERDQMVVSPRSLSFPKGGKVKPNCVPESGARDAWATHAAAAAAVTALEKSVATEHCSVAVRSAKTPSDDANNAAHRESSSSPDEDLSMQDLHVCVQALHGSDSVANLLSLPRSASTHGLLPLTTDGPPGVTFMEGLGP